MKKSFEKLERKYDKMRRQRDEARAELLKLRPIQVTVKSSDEYKIREMHIDCEKKDFEVGKWYKNITGFVRSRFTEKDSVNSGYEVDYWVNDISMTDLKYWEEMTPKEIELLLTKRCKELSLFDGEFECLSGFTFYNHKGFVNYRGKYDQLWIGNNVAYEKGKFAKLVQ